MAVNNTLQNSIVAAGAGGSVTTGIEWAFNLGALGYTSAMYSSGTPINIEAMISYGSHTVGTNQILGGYTPAQSELNNDGGIYTFFGSGNFDFSNNTRFGGNQYFTALTPAIYAINAGGSAIAAFAGDNNGSYISGSASIGAATDPIDLSGTANAMPASLYQTERYGGNFTYTFGGFAPGSTHRITLGFAEIYWTATGQRVFNVTANGVAKLTNFDVFAAAGGKDKAINQTFTAVADANGNIALNFVAVVDNAKVGGIEIF